MDGDYRPLICTFTNDDKGQQAILRHVADALRHDIAVTVRPAGRDIGLFLADPPRSFAIFQAIVGVIIGGEAGDAGGRAGEEGEHDSR